MPETQTRPGTFLDQRTDRHRLYQIPDADFLAATDPAAATALLWTGWRVAHLYPYTVRSAWASAILTRTDGPTGWAATTLSVTGDWATADAFTRRINTGWFTTASLMLPEGDLFAFAKLVRAAAAAAPDGDEARAEYHHPWLWKALLSLPVEAVPEAAAMRMLLALTDSV